MDTREGVEGAVEGARVRAEEVSGLEGIAEVVGTARGERERERGGVEGGEGGEGGEGMDLS